MVEKIKKLTKTELREAQRTARIEASKKRKEQKEIKKQEKIKAEYAKTYVTQEDVSDLAKQIKNMQKDFTAGEENDDVDIALANIRNDEYNEGINDEENNIDDDILAEEEIKPVKPKKSSKNVSVPLNLKIPDVAPNTIKIQSDKPVPVEIKIGNSLNNPFVINKHYNELHNYLSELFGSNDNTYFLLNESRSIFNPKIKQILIEDKYGFKYRIFVDTRNILLGY